MKTFLASAHLRVQPAVVLGPAASAPQSVRRYVQIAAFGLLAFGSAGLATPALAQQTEPVVVKKVNDTTFRVRIQNPTQQVGQVRVWSLVTGNNLFYERYNTAQYGHDLNFRNLQSGQYVILMQVGPSKYRYTVQVQSQPQPSVALRTFTVKTRGPKLSPASAAL